MVEIQEVSKGRIEAKAGGPWAMRLVTWEDKGDGVPWAMRADVGGRMLGDRSPSESEEPMGYPAVSWRLVSIDSAGAVTVYEEFQFVESYLYRTWGNSGVPEWHWRVSVDIAAAGLSRVVSMGWQCLSWQNGWVQRLATNSGNTYGQEGEVVRSAVLAGFENGRQWAIDVLIGPKTGDDSGWFGLTPGAEAYVVSEGGVLIATVPGVAAPGGAA